MIKLIAVDLQYDFTRPRGKHYNPLRESVPFVRDTFVPFLAKKKVRIGEIISDYRLPRPGDEDDSCRPGEWGYKSEIPEKIVETRWIKCLNSPYFTRENIGVPNKKPGLPVENATGFYWWLVNYAGDYTEGAIIVLFGLTLDCCLLCTAQATKFRGFDVRILTEATDTYLGGAESRSTVMNLVANNWAKEISFEEVRQLLNQEKGTK